MVSCIKVYFFFFVVGVCLPWFILLNKREGECLFKIFTYVYVHFLLDFFFCAIASSHGNSQ